MYGSQLIRGAQMEQRQTGTWKKQANQLKRVLMVFSFLTLASTLLPSVARGQSYVYQVGTPTFTTALPVENGFVNMANGDLHLEIPLGDFPQRGGRSLSPRLVYDSRIWLLYSGPPAAWQPWNVGTQLGGWRFATNATTSAGPSFITTNARCRISFNPPIWEYYTQYFDFIYTEPNGTTHTFYIHTVEDDGGSCNVDQPNGSGYALDSSGYHMIVTITPRPRYSPQTVLRYILRSKIRTETITRSTPLPGMSPIP